MGGCLQALSEASRERRIEPQTCCAGCPCQIENFFVKAEATL
jgi:hypothetical protein